MISQSSPLSSAVNSLSLFLRTNVDVSEIRITVSGLEDATPCTHPVLVTATRDGVAAPGMVDDDLSLWSDAGGVFNMKLSSLSSTPHMLTFSVRNPAFARASPAISIAAFGISGIREIAIIADEMGKGDGPAWGVPAGQQPMHGKFQNPEPQTLNPKP